MQEPFSSRGYWFLPGRSDKPVAGILDYSQVDGLRLRLMGELELDASAPVLGTVSQNPYGRLISLYRCFEVGRTLTSPGFQEQELRATWAVVGSEHLASEQEGFSVAYLGIDGVSEWAIEPSIRIGPQPLQVSFAAPSEYRGVIPDGSVSLKIKGTPRLGRHKIEVVEEATLQIRTRPFTLMELRQRYVGPLQTLLSFAMDTAAHVNQFALQRDHDNGQYHCLYEPISRRSARSATAPREPLFRLLDIQSHFDKLVARWFQFLDTNPGFVDVFSGLYYAPPAYQDTRFQWVTHALCLLESARGGESRSDPHAYLTWPVHLPDFVRSLLNRLGAELVPATTSVDEFVEEVRKVQRTVLQRTGENDSQEIFWTTERLWFAVKAATALALSDDDFDLRPFLLDNRKLLYMREFQ